MSRRAGMIFVTLSLVAGCGSSNDGGATADAANDSTDPDAPLDAPTTDAPGDASGDAATDVAGDAPEQPLDCAWVNDPKNCWRAFVADVDACLGNPVASGVHGAFAAGAKTCAYPTPGRTVDFAIAATPDGSPDRADRDFTVSLAATKCIRYVETAAINGFSVTSPAGTLSYTAIGNDVHLVCPDGSRWHGDALSIAKLCGPALLAGGAPDRTLVSGGGEVRFQLRGMKDVVFDCLTGG